LSSQKQFNIQSFNFICYELPAAVLCEFLFLTFLDYVTELIMDKPNFSLSTLQNEHHLIYRFTVSSSACIVIIQCILYLIYLNGWKRTHEFSLWEMYYSTDQTLLETILRLKLNNKIKG